MCATRLSTHDQSRTPVADTEEGDCGANLLISLGRRYGQYINKTYKRTGILWGSRYKSSIVQADNDLLACQRHIELNPVRAAMVEDPGRYRWSSHRANGLARKSGILNPHSVYMALGDTDKERRQNYRDLFRSELDREAISDIRLALNQNQPIGNERFLARIENLTGIRRQAKSKGRTRKVADRLGAVGQQAEICLE